MKRLIILACALLTLGLAACGGDDDDDGGGENASAKSSQAENTPAPGGGGRVRVAFSAPAADHGWLAAITKDAKNEAKKLGDVDLEVSASAANSAEQADQIETLIQGKPDVLVVLPFEGDALTPVAQKATASGIPVINVDREFSTPGAYRTWIGGDNYGIGWQAGNYFADQLKCKGNVAEIQGLAGISVTELRTKGFNDAIKRRCQDGIKVVARQPADFLPDKGLSVMENILQGNKDLDAVYTHDDDMAEGVVSAIENANRQDDMFLTGAGGSKAAMKRIKDGGLYRATFLYNPVMSASAVRLARLIARNQGMQELAEPEVPSRIQVPATTVTKDNVDKLMDLGF